ncbi:LuxR C-terminal-related transcriptional regulator [Streptomyces sp. NPDC046939]|uniref:helix-turn-helix transcriptional regulator n=1 Tax=Streptomyces sp. NPDC046939 TaxID=3155376 RepID=UPI0033F61C21
MAHLPSGDDDRILELAAALLDDVHTTLPWEQIVRELVEPLHASMGVVVVLRWAAGEGKMVAGTPGSLGQSRMDRLISEHMRAHPLMRLYARPGRHAALTLDEVVDRTWRRTATHRAGADMGVTQQLAIPLDAPAGVVRSVVLGRDGGNFTDRDRRFAQRLQPLLVRIDHHVRELERLRAALPPPFTDSAATADAYAITPREMTVLGLLSEGLTAAATARRLGVSEHTVHRHLENIYRKLGTHDRVTTVLLAARLGLVPVCARLPSAGHSD